MTSGSVDNMRVPVLVSGDTISSSTRITDDRVVIVGVYWFNPTTSAHLAAFQDKDGNELLELKAVVATQGIYLQNIRIPANGIYMDDLDSGSVYIYLETT